MKVGVLSDTHVREGSSLAASLLEAFSGVEMIMHAGDIVSLLVIEALEAIAPVHAVHGNMDPFEVASALPGQRVIQVGAKVIGLIHGWGAPQGLENRLLERFSQDSVDAIVYGHTHLPALKKIGSVLFFNPGSATGRFPAPCASVGILHVDDDIAGELVRL